MIRGKGKIVFSHNGTIKHVQDVLYVPNVHKNLLSIGKIIDKGCLIVFRSQNC